MLVRDVRTGQLVAVPDNRFAAAPFGGYGTGSHAPRSGCAAVNGSGFAAAPQQVIYDGLGNPLGLPFLAALAPMAASVLPSLLPMIPSLTGGLASLLKSLGGPLSGVPPGGSGFGYDPSPNMHGLGAMPGLGYYGAVPPQVIYDGLGNPLGLPFLAALAPMLSSLLPSLASGAAKVLPGLISQAATALPALAQSAPPAQPSPPQPHPAPDASNVPPAPVPPVTPMPDSRPPEMAPAPRMPMPPPDEIVAPMRVQGPNGQPMIVPVRLRRRGRRRGRRMRSVQPLVIARPPISNVGFAPGFASPSNLHGWFGFNGWRGG